MVGSFGEVLVLDWGVARVLSEVPGRDAGFALGTPGFMAPEQAAGHGTVDEKADVYALGGVLFFLLTGHTPPAGFDEDRNREIDRRLGAVRDGALRAVCRKALALDAANRYPSVALLARDVARYLTGLPVSAHRETVLERATRLAVKYKTPILLVLAYLLMRAVLLLV
jgi:serine/threonine protein kinase